MDYLVDFQLNFYAIIILIILYIAIMARVKVNHTGKQLFRYAIILIGAAIIIEPLTWIFDGTHFFGSYFLEYFTNFLLLLLAPIICGFMLSYIDYYIYKDRKRLYRRYFYLLPSLFTVVMLIINIFHPIYFSIDRINNAYHTENLLWIQYVMIGCYYIYMLIFSSINRKKIHKSALAIFFVFFSLPLLGMAVQLFLPRFFFSWTSIVLSLLVIFIFLESTSGEKDYLTKLYSRQSYEKYLNYLIDKDSKFSILFIDLNEFKGINDKLGHFTGDKVLIGFSRSLIKVFSPNRMVSRLGGDEFTVVIENDIVIEEEIKNMYKHLQTSDLEPLRTLKFSYGYQQYEDHLTLDKLYIKVDKNMYQHKHNID